MLAPPLVSPANVIEAQILLLRQERSEFEGGFTLRVGDTLVLTGAHADTEEAFRRLR